MTQEKRAILFEKTPIKKAVALQIVPSVLGQMISLVYSIADTYFVGKLNSPLQSAAIMVVSSPFLLLTAISNLFGIGGAGAIARALGAKKNDEAKHISSIVFWLGLFCSALVSLLFWIFSKHVLAFCGAETDNFAYCYSYAKWVIVFGGTATILSSVLANVVRAEGSSLKAAIGVSLGGAINIILDPLFILPQFIGLGVTGAGIATALSNTASCLYFIIIISACKGGSSYFSLKSLGQSKKYFSAVVVSGFPSALQYMLTVLAVAFQSHFVSHYGSYAVAALGIVKKLDQLPLYFSIGVSTGILPLLSYTHSSGDKKRHGDALKLGCAVSLTFSLFCLVVYEIFAPRLAALFIADKQTVSYAASFLRRMVTAMPMMSVCYPIIIRFQAIGKIKESVVCSVIRKGVIDLPLLIVADSLMPLYGLMWVQPIVDSISLAVAILFSLRILRRKKA